MSSVLPRVLCLVLGAVVLVPAVVGCSRSPKGSAPSPSATAITSRPARGLSAEDAAQVLATVGDVKITLGDYASAIERMDRYERLRYQSADRRKVLLDEMINLELLAQEARRQKLDVSPEFQLRLDQALRDEVLLDLRASIPGPESIPLPEVRAYYEAHRAEYREPERRRVSAIVVSDESKAKSLLDQAKKADAAGFGELVRKHSQQRVVGESTPLELEGDLGIVSAKGEPQGKGPVLPDTVVTALFELTKVGDVYGKPVRAGQAFYILRMTGRTEARDRSFAEAERSIRVRLVDARTELSEKQLVERLKQEMPITIDDTALAKLPPERTTKTETLRDAIRP